MILKGRTALVTGSSRGIGRSIAIELAKAGAIVAINYKEDIDGANETLNIIKNSGSYCAAVQGDVGSSGGAKQIIDDTIEKLGSIDILVNNAGISKIGLLIDMQEEEISNILDVNLKGIINCSKYALEYMLPRKKGNIVNISSIWGNVGASCETVYSAAKGGINSFTKALAKEVGPSNIRVNGIAPGIIDTKMNSWLSNEERDILKNDIPLMGFGTGEDIGKLVVFLASESSKYITGQIITADGGMI